MKRKKKRKLAVGKLLILYSFHLEESFQRGKKIFLLEEPEYRVLDNDRKKKIR